MDKPSGSFAIVRAILVLGRASEWWEYKLVPAVLVGYATALHAGFSPWQALSGLGMLLVTLIPGGIYVSVINDFTDRSDDAAAGKVNRQQGRNPAIAASIIALCLAAGGAIVWFFRDAPGLIGVYGAGWIAFSLYSLPPFRLKSRGLAGVICDAAGAHLVPALLAILLVERSLYSQAQPEWMISAGCWSFLYGLRSIICHQLGDLDADRQSGTRTFVATIGPLQAARAVKWVVFPLELVMLAALLIQAGLAACIAALMGLIAYGYLIYQRFNRFDMSLTLVQPKPRSSIVLHEYYDVFLPLGLLLAGRTFQLDVFGLLILHCIIFPMRLVQVVSEFRKFWDPQFVPRSKRNYQPDAAGDIKPGTNTP